MHGSFHPWNERRVHAELIHSQAEKQWNQGEVARHLAANSHPDVVGMRRVRHHLKKAQDRWMRRLIEIRDPLVDPVHRDRVLNEIVCADAEKIDFARQPVG